MSVVLPQASPARRREAVLTGVLVAGLVLAAIWPAPLVRGVDASPEHLVVSEVVTGGSSASDELIELYNPTGTPLPLEGLELIYVSASGATVSRRASWVVGDPSIPAAGHYLIANEAGLYAPIADALYAGGMAATGGSVALRIQGATSALDAVGWGEAVSAWREGPNAAAPAAGASIERLPGGALGSTQDTDDNAVDFAQRLVPDAQNLSSSLAPDPDSPGPQPTPVPTPTPSVTASPSPAPSVLSVEDAREVADGTVVTVEAVAVAGSAFHDGGGFVADETGGIAVLLEEGSFERGTRLRVTGLVDDRFSQRTIRAAGSDLVDLGAGPEPVATIAPTGGVNETVEGRLVRIAGIVAGAPTTLTSGVAFDVDDGSGTVRLIIGTQSGIDVAGWSPGTQVDLVGVAGQRDSTGSGVEGYRIMLRDPDDVIALESPTPAPSPIGDPDATPTQSPSDDPAAVSSIAEARAAPKNARLTVRGVITLPPGIVDPGTAVIADGSGAIALRLGDEVGSLRLGHRVEVTGVRSTKSGMETLRVTQPALTLGSGTEPAAHLLRTGDAAEAYEAKLVIARGALVASARRASSGTVSFEIDDGSGPLRVVLGASLAADSAPLVAGTRIEVRGVLGQETTGALPSRGYRIWPRGADELRIVARVTDAAPGQRSPTGEGHDGASGPTGLIPSATLADVGGADLSGLRVGAALVSGPWKELGIGGLLWDGSRLVAIDASSSSRVRALLGSSTPPLALELAGLRKAGSEPRTGAALVTLGDEPEDTRRADRPPAAPRADLAVHDGDPAWVSLVGRIVGGADDRRLIVGSVQVPIEILCDAAEAPKAAGMRGVTGVATGEPVRLLVPCGGVRAAPGVVRAGLEAATDPDMNGGGRDAAPGTTTIAGHDGRRALIAGLLALGALLLVGAASAGRWWPEPATEAGRASDPAIHEEDERDEIPRLRLVRVPHERGP